MISQISYKKATKQSCNLEKPLLPSELVHELVQSGSDDNSETIVCVMFMRQFNRFTILATTFFDELPQLNSQSPPLPVVISMYMYVCRCQMTQAINYVAYCQDTVLQLKLFRVCQNCVSTSKHKIQFTFFKVILYLH